MYNIVSLLRDQIVLSEKVVVLHLRIAFLTKDLNCQSVNMQAITLFALGIYKRLVG